MSPYEFVQRAQKLIRGGQHQEAVKVCRLGLLAQPKDVEGRLILGSALMALRRYDEVLAEMRVALEIDADSPRALVLKGEALLRKGDAPAAVGILERAKALGAGTSVAALLEEAQGAARRSSPFSDPRPPEPGGRPRAPLTDDYVDRDGPTKHYPFRREQQAESLAKVPSLPASPPSARPGSGQPRADSMDEATVVADTPGAIAPDDSGALIEVRSVDVVHETAAGSTVLDRPGPRQPSSPADIDQMFPEDDEGVSRLELKSPDEIEQQMGRVMEARNPAPAPALGSPPPARSPSHSPAPSPAPQPASPPTAAPEDMKKIRAGLGLPAEDSGGFRAQLRAELTARKPRRESDRPQSKTKAKPKARTGRLYLAGYAAIALVILGGAVFAGLQIREARLKSRVEKAASDATALARADTYAGYVAAKEARERIFGVASTEAAKAAFARAQAELAFVFGDGVDEARKLAESVADSKAVDALVARALMALNAADAKTAHELAKAIADDEQGAGIADFIAGYAHLIDGDATEAKAAFERALKAEDRPRHRLGLSRAMAAGGDFKGALAQIAKVFEKDPDHPAALILEARILAATGETKAAAARSKALTAITTSKSAAPARKLWARLALAEVALASGEAEKAKAAIAPLAKATIEDFALAESSAAVFLALGDAASATTVADQAQKAWPGRKQPKVLAARAHVLAGNPQAALAVFSRAGDLTGMPAALAARGRAHLLAGDVEAAAADLDEALKLDDSLIEAQVARARVDLARDDAAAALARLRPLHEANPDPEVTVAYAAALARVGKDDEAQALLSKLVKTGAGWRARLELARIARRKGNFETASEHYRTVLAKTSSPALRVEAAGVVFEAGDAQAALEILEPALKSDRTGSRILIFAARLHNAIGKRKEAVALLDKAAKKPDPPVWLLSRERGRMALAKEDAKAAVRHLRASLKVRSDNAETWLLLLSAQLALEDADAAKKTVTEIGEWFPSSGASALARGRLAYYETQPEAALSAFRSARKRLRKENAPPRDRALASYWIGRVHYYTGTLDRAREALTEAIELSPSLTAAYLTLGNVEYGLEDFAAAAKAYQRVTELAPDGNPDVWFYLGDMATRIGKKKLARKALETYQRRAPKGDYAKDAARLLKSL